LERWEEKKSGGVSSLGVLVTLLPAYLVFLSGQNAADLILFDK
jgi:hypothetical protein